MKLIYVVQFFNTTFNCKDGYLTIESKYLCDGVYNCMDFSDEENCGNILGYIFSNY